MNSKTVKKELVGLEKDYWRAIKEQDVEAINKLTDYPCIVAGAQGVGRLDKKAMTAMMSAAPWRLREFEFDDDVEVRLIADDVAVLAYKVHEQLTVDGKPVALDAADASVWVRRNGRWLCALHTESLAGDPYGRERHAA